MQQVTVICYFRFTGCSTKSTAFPGLIIYSKSATARQKFLPDKGNIQKKVIFQ